MLLHACMFTAVAKEDTEKQRERMDTWLNNYILILLLLCIYLDVQLHLTRIGTLHVCLFVFYWNYIAFMSSIDLFMASDWHVPMGSKTSVDDSFDAFEHCFTILVNFQETTQHLRVKRLLRHCILICFML